MVRVKAMRTRLSRFTALTQKTNGCWLWRGTCTREQQRARMWDKGRSRPAAHVAYELFVGPINGKWVLHTCDNPTCVNPAHLYLGDHSRNMRDMVDRKRKAVSPGESNPQAKLTETQVIEIRRRYRRGNGVRLAREYGIRQQQISRIVQRQRWKHV